MAGPITVQCPNCESKLRIKNSSALGKKAPCPKCGESFVLEAPSDADEDFGFSADDDFASEPDPPSSRTRAAGRGGKSSSKSSGKGKKSKRSSDGGEWKLPVFLGGGALLVVGIVIGVFQFLKSSGSSEEIADNSSSPASAAAPVAPASIPTMPTMPPTMHGGPSAPAMGSSKPELVATPVVAGPPSGHGVPGGSTPPGYPTNAFIPASNAAAPSGPGGPTSAFVSTGPIGHGGGSQHGAPAQFSSPTGSSGGHGGPSGHGGPGGSAPAQAFTSTAPGHAGSPGASILSIPPGQPASTFNSSGATSGLLGGYAPPMAGPQTATPPSGASPTSLLGKYTNGGTASAQYTPPGSVQQLPPPAGEQAEGGSGKGFLESLLSGGKSSKKDAGAQAGANATGPAGMRSFDPRQYGSAPPNNTGPNGLISGPGEQQGANAAGNNAERRPLSSAARRRLREGRTAPKAQDTSGDTP